MKDKIPVICKKLDDIIIITPIGYGKTYYETKKIIKQKDKEIKRLNNIINELEKHLHQEILEWQDTDDVFIKAQVQEDRIILDYLKELKGSN